MKLHDQMNDAVADITADTGALMTSARKRGLGMRRRRQALGTVGAAAAVAAIVGGALALQPGGDTSRESGAATDPTASSAATSPAGGTVPLSGRATAAALMAAVDEVADGTFSDFTGQDPYPPGDGGAQSYAEFRLTPDGEGFGVVGVNIQPLSILDERDCPADPEGAKKCEKRVRPSAYACDQAFMRECESTVLPNGDTLRTYRDDVTGIRLVAELLSPERELRVVASATNGLDLPNSKWDTKRPDAVLTVDQLSDVVSQPWWGFQLPAEHDGSQLPDYEDVPVTLDATPID